MIIKKNIDIDSFDEFKINADCFFDNSKKNLPLVIFSHGFKGFKDWGGFPYMMERLAEAGFYAVSFNFTHNGVDKDHPSEFARLDLFSENTFSRELNELNYVIDYFYPQDGVHNSAEISKDNIGLIGHSRGGGISILQASSDNRVKCIVSLASVSAFDRYSESLKKKWREDGFIEVLNSRTNQMMKMNVSLLDDTEKNKKELNIIEAAAKMDKPFLIIHGTEDLAVPPEAAEELYSVSDKKQTEMVIIPNTGHTFGITHPFSGTTPAFENVIEKLIRFMKNHSI